MSNILYLMIIFINYIILFHTSLCPLKPTSKKLCQISKNLLFLPWLSLSSLDRKVLRDRQLRVWKLYTLIITLNNSIKCLFFMLYNTLYSVV